MPLSATNIQKFIKWEVLRYKQDLDLKLCDVISNYIFWIRILTIKLISDFYDELNSCRIPVSSPVWFVCSSKLRVLARTWNNTLLTTIPEYWTLKVYLT